MLMEPAAFWLLVICTMREAISQRSSVLCAIMQTCVAEHWAAMLKLFSTLTPKVVPNANPGTRYSKGSPLCLALKFFALLIEYSRLHPKEGQGG
jgi:hypothetical protein